MLDALWAAIGPYKALLEFMVVLSSLYFGARISGIGLGLVPAIGLVILVFVFGLEPGKPPVTVMLIIIAAVSCAAVLQATSAIDWMIMQAEKLLRSYPKAITFLGPLCTWGLTVVCGTGHVVYTIMPIIADIAHRNGIRPERAVAVSSVASQMGITASPVAAATVTFLAQSTEYGASFTMGNILAVTMTATLSGILLAALWSNFRGKDLSDDEEYQKRLADPAMREYMFGEEQTMLNKTFSMRAPLSVLMFLGGLAVIILLAQVEGLRPLVGGKPASMNLLIQMILMACAAIILLTTRIKPSTVIEGNVFRSGMLAVMIIFGIAWMSDTFFSAYTDEMKVFTESFITKTPWLFAFALFFVSVFINSQGATTVTVMPIGFSLGISPLVLLGVFPAVYGYFFIPNYPSDIASMNFDRSGTTKIGKYLLNHSFMVPGLIGVTTACIVGSMITKVMF